MKVSGEQTTRALVCDAQPLRGWADIRGGQYALDHLVQQTVQSASCVTEYPQARGEAVRGNGTLVIAQSRASAGCRQRLARVSHSDARATRRDSIHRRRSRHAEAVAGVHRCLGETMSARYPNQLVQAGLGSRGRSGGLWNSGQSGYHRSRWGRHRQPIARSLLARAASRDSRTCGQLTSTADQPRASSPASRRTP